MIKVMGSFFRKLIFVANTCAIITQIDIHLFIHSFIHSFIVVVVVKFFIREWPHLFTFFKFFNHKNRRKKRANNNNNNGEENVIFFLYCLIFLEHLIFWLSHILSSSTCTFTFTFTFTYNINYLFNLLTFKHSNILNNQLLLFMIITIQRLFFFFCFIFLQHIYLN